MVSITATKIKKFLPEARPGLVKAIIEGWPAAEAAGIITPVRIQHFFAQMATETAGLKAIAENLNYKATALRSLFSKERISDNDCTKLGRTDDHAADQEAIANTIYGGAWGKKHLGNTKKGDGWRYRGSGFIQTTGRTNFRAAGHEDDPDTLRTPLPGFAAALVYWSDHKINAAADDDDVKAVRRKINPGLFGLAETEAFLKRARKVFG
jgi:putative chitinase